MENEDNLKRKRRRKLMRGILTLKVGCQRKNQNNEKSKPATPLISFVLIPIGWF